MEDKIITLLDELESRLRHEHSFEDSDIVIVLVNDIRKEAASLLTGEHA